MTITYDKIISKSISKFIGHDICHRSSILRQKFVLKMCFLHFYSSVMILIISILFVKIKKMAIQNISIGGWDLLLSDKIVFLTAGAGWIA
ncbi:unnamed protein product [Rotaria socialis]